MIYVAYENLWAAEWIYEFKKPTPVTCHAQKIDLNFYNYPRPGCNLELFKIVYKSR